MAERQLLPASTMFTIKKGAKWACPECAFDNDGGSICTTCGKACPADAVAGWIKEEQPLGWVWDWILTIFLYVIFVPIGIVRHLHVVGKRFDLWLPQFKYLLNRITVQVCWHMYQMFAFITMSSIIFVVTVQISIIVYNTVRYGEEHHTDWKQDWKSEYRFLICWGVIAIFAIGIAESAGNTYTGGLITGGAPLNYKWILLTGVYIFLGVLILSFMGAWINNIQWMYQENTPERQLLETCLAAIQVATVFFAYACTLRESRTCTIDDVGEIPGSKYKFNCKGLSMAGRLIIPSSVRSIGGGCRGNGAFQGCTQLTSITMPNSVHAIGGYAFADCIRIASVTFPNSLATIADGAFDGCANLESVHIPDTVDTIGKYAFRGCSELRSVTIPCTVTSICDYTFKGCAKLHFVAIQNNVASIGDYAFYQCSELPEITIPNSVKTIGNAAFKGCSNMHSLALSSSTTDIPYQAFQGCIKLTSVVIPTAVKRIGSYAFAGCSGLKMITIPESVTAIESGAFANCTALTSVPVSDAMTAIAESTFKGCTGFTSATIPSSVITIGQSAFQGCTRLKSVIIPQSVKTIRDDAFKQCDKLTFIKIPDCFDPKKVFPDIPDDILAEAIAAHKQYQFRTAFNVLTMSQFSSNQCPGGGRTDSRAAFDKMQAEEQRSLIRHVNFDKLFLTKTVPNMLFAKNNSGASSGRRSGSESGGGGDSSPTHAELSTVWPPSVALHAMLPSFERESGATSMEARINRVALATANLADELKGVFKRVASIRHRTAACSRSNLSNLSNSRKVQIDVSASTTTALQFRQLLQAQPALLQPDIAPLSDRLVALKNVLNICLQFELTFPPPTISNIDFGLHMQMHVDPAIAIIVQGLDAMKAQVAANPDKYQQLLVDLSKADLRIYDETFSKTVNAQLGGDEPAYIAMLQQCTDLKTQCTVDGGGVQPTTELIPLVLAVRKQIPLFQAAVSLTVAQAAADSGGNAAPTSIIYRPHNETKAPYRIIEKALIKGPNKQYPDCSKVLDIFGCMIVCADYISMAAVISAFAVRHKSRGAKRTSGHMLQLCRIKDRWAKPSSGGWRDVMLNVVVGGVIFEVQIVLHAMLVARTALDAHKAYNQFRSFAEIFDSMDLDCKGMDDVGCDAGDDGIEEVDGIDTVVSLRTALGHEQAAHAETQKHVSRLHAALREERVAHAETRKELVAELAFRNQTSF